MLSYFNETQSYILKVVLKIILAYLFICDFWISKDSISLGDNK